MGIITKNSEILFIYDAKMSNPNGDMDNENKPRMDFDTEINLVSDVRLKRYLRDYFESFCEKNIFITEKAENAEKRFDQMKENGLVHKDLIDVRLFGAVFAAEGGNDHLTGPIQFNWGYSLNRVELTDSNTITSSFSDSKGIGKDYRVKYSFIAFNGSINANVAKGTGLSDEDIDLFDEAMIKAIPFCKTRSKIGQTPRLYIRIQMKDNSLILKDLREYVSRDSLDMSVEDYKLRNIKEVVLDLSQLAEYLKKYKEKIEKIFLWKDDNLEIKGFDDLESVDFNIE